MVERVFWSLPQKTAVWVDLKNNRAVQWSLCMFWNKIVLTIHLIGWRNGSRGHGGIRACGGGPELLRCGAPARGVEVGREQAHHANRKHARRAAAQSHDAAP